MNKEDYLERIEKLKKSLLNGECAQKEKEVLEELETLFQYKPVHAEWFLTRAIYERVVKQNVVDAGKYLQYVASDRTRKQVHIDYLEERIKCSQLQNWQNEKKRFEMKKKMFISGNGCVIGENKLVLLLQKLENDQISLESAKTILQELYISADLCMYLLMYMYFTKVCKYKVHFHSWITNMDNYGVFESLMAREEELAITIISVGRYNRSYMSIVERIFAKIGYSVRNVFTEKIDGKFICELDKITKQDGFSYVFASGAILDKCAVENNRIERLSVWQADYLEGNLAFGWMGDYLSYISHLYQMDTKKCLESEGEVEFSIVIPVRNNAECLKSLIDSCLEQRYTGNYEIVVSDNSTIGNNIVREYIETICDERVNYFRTPRELSLSKSFEFAVLQAKGKFILTIGADDAVLPWCLDVLSKITKEYCESEVLVWDRGFYAWPGFNSRQENQFVIPAKYEKDKVVVEEKQYLEEVWKILQGEYEGYTLPNLYINSGFKRSYLKTLLNQTGRLWDGICQDLYMGIITAAICENIRYIHYPLTIAGMSTKSVGAKGNMGEIKVKEMNNAKQKVAMGYWTSSYFERLLPNIGSDVASVYLCVLRAIQRKIFPVEWIDDTIRWENWYVNLVEKLNVKDLWFAHKLSYIQWSAYRLGDEFGKWFEQINEIMLEPHIINDVNKHEGEATSYEEGNTSQGGCVLDASKYDVKNAYEASKLFEKISGL